MGTLPVEPPGKPKVRVSVSYELEIAPLAAHKETCVKTMVDCIEKSGPKAYQKDKMWLSWSSRKTLSSSPLKATAKLELITEQLLMKKTGNNQKKSSTPKGIKKEPQ